MEYLRFCVTYDGAKPIHRNIEAINNIKPPTFQKGVQQFIGVLNYYHDMCPTQSHMLEALTRITPNKRNFRWTKIEQFAFNEFTRILFHDTLLSYPDFNPEFKIHTDARGLQLGAVIIHKNKPIALYSKKTY